jgi:hypothetical protein
MSHFVLTANPLSQVLPVKTNAMRYKTDRINKYKALYQILNQYAEAFEGEALASVESLGTLNDRFSALVSNLTRPVSLVYQNKTSRRDSFIESLQQAVKLGMAVARKTGNTALMDAATNYRREIGRTSDHKLYEMALHMNELLTPHSEMMGSLGNQTAFMVQFANQIQEFSQTLSGTGLSLNERKSGRRELNALLTECNQLLIQELDGLVATRKHTHGELYNLYTTMRMNRRSRSKVGEKPGLSDISGMITNAVTGDPVADAQITLAQHATVTETDDDGFFAHEELHEGTYTVGCFAPGYHVPEKATVKLGYDESVEINFALQPINPMLN